MVVFLSQGYVTSGQEALLRTIWISGGAAILDLLLKAILIYGCGIQLFLSYNDGDGMHEQRSWSKWGFWLAHHATFSVVYFGIIVLPYTPWRDRLPARPSFYRYVGFLFAINMGSFIASILLGSGPCQLYSCDGKGFLVVRMI